MMLLTALIGIIAAFCSGVCVGAIATEDVDGELRLPFGWWVLPALVMGGLLLAVFVVWTFA